MRRRCARSQAHGAPPHRCALRGSCPGMTATARSSTRRCSRAEKRRATCSPAPPAPVVAWPTRLSSAEGPCCPTTSRTASTACGRTWGSSVVAAVVAAPGTPDALPVLKCRHHFRVRWQLRRQPANLFGVRQPPLPVPTLRPPRPRAWLQQGGTEPDAYVMTHTIPREMLPSRYYI